MAQQSHSVILAPNSAWADARLHPDYFEAVTLKRIVAYILDIVLVAIISVAVWFASLLLGIVSLGLLLPLQALMVALVPLAYHTLLVSGRHAATFGMRAMGLKVVSIAPQIPSGGGRPTVFQAMILTVAFYGSIALTGSLILVVALFNARRRTLHDWLAGTVVVNTLPMDRDGISPG